MKTIWFIYTTELFMHVFVAYLGRLDMLILLYMILMREQYYKLEDILEVIN